MAASSSSGTKRQREVASAGPGTSFTPPVSDANDIPRPTFTLSPDKFNLKCKVGSKCKLKEDLKYIEECLSDHPDGIMWFQNSQFAPLFDVASDMDMVLTHLWMLLTRIVESPDHSEIWFVVNDIPIRYSLLEHAIMSGLNCSRYPAASKVVEDDNFNLRYHLLDCEIFFVPIHKPDHWCLVIIKKKEQKLQYLDSDGGQDEEVLKFLAMYFVDEVKHKSGEVIDLSLWNHEYTKNLPRQENNYDCGMFMIKYADFCSSSAGIGLCFGQADMSYFRQRVVKEILNLRVD